MPRIQKDYNSRRRTPSQNNAPNLAADEAKMSGNSGTGAQQSNKEGMIAHQKAVHDRTQRRQVPNQKLRVK